MVTSNIRHCTAGTSDINAGSLGGINVGLTTETISIATLTLDETSFTPGVSFNFAPTFYANGFQIFDDSKAGGALLLSADLTVTSLDVIGAGGDINSGFGLNLTNITSPLAPGTSAIIDSFLSAPGGATTISLQIAGDVTAAITAGPGVLNTFSGTAAPVPEPGTVALLGMGLAGLIGVGARKKIKKDKVK